MDLNIWEITTVLIIPLLVYIWFENRREVKSMDKKFSTHIDQMNKYERGVDDKVDKLSEEIRNSKSDYIERIANLKEQINDKFEVVNNSVKALGRELSDSQKNYIERFGALKDQINEKFITVNSSINEIGKDVKAIVILIENEKKIIISKKD